MAIPKQSKLRRLRSTRRLAMGFIRTFDLDVLQMETPPFVAQLPVPVYITIYDLRSMHRPIRDVRSTAAVYQRVFLPRHVSRVDGVIAVSNWAKLDMCKRLPVEEANVHVVPICLPSLPNISAPAAEPQLLPSSVPERFVLALGHLEQRKNLQVLAAAAALPNWPSSMGLVIAGQDHGSGPELQELADRVDTDVVIVGAVSDEVKWKLLKGASITLIPSLIEGFGIVALESIACGTPILVADASALPEVVGVPRAVLDPDSPAAWAQAVGSFAASQSKLDDLLREEVRSTAGYFTSADADALAMLYTRAVGGGRVEQWREQDAG
jgi:glycosyltransferase involved in cell wall biosynthesis